MFALHAQRWRCSAALIEKMFCFFSAFCRDSRRAAATLVDNIASSATVYLLICRVIRAATPIIRHHSTTVQICYFLLVSRAPLL